MYLIFNDFWFEQLLLFNCKKRSNCSNPKSLKIIYTVASLRTLTDQLLIYLFFSVSCLLNWEAMKPLFLSDNKLCFSLVDEFLSSFVAFIDHNCLAVFIKYLKKIKNSLCTCNFSEQRIFRIYDRSR